MLPPSAEIQIDGNKLCAGFVSEIYAELTFDHVLTVIQNFNNLEYEIRHIKTYLRTALYNSVFELEGRTENDVKTETPWNGKNG